MPPDPPTPSDWHNPQGERFTIYVCDGCGAYGGENELDRLRDGLVTHNRMTEGCVGPARRVDVVAAAARSPDSDAPREISDAEARREAERALEYICEVALSGHHDEWAPGQVRRRASLARWRIRAGRGFHHP
ncbi:MAG: hypothetical protein ACRD2Z_09605, partial [Thermoanaerobaculia bacterium]